MAIPTSMRWYCASAYTADGIACRAVTSRCVVTGASGFVAGFVIAELEADYDLTLLSRRHFHTPHRLVTGTPVSLDDCIRAFEGAGAVLHIGAMPGPAPDTFTVNTSSTYNVMEAARHHGIGRVVFASSNCVYSQCHCLSGRPFVPRRLPIDESQPCEPEDNYGLSKLVNEQTLAAFRRAHGIEVAALRLNWVFGPDDYQPRMADLDLAQHAQTLWAYVDARDAARAFRLALEASELPDDPAYNISARDTLAEEDSAGLVARFRPDLADLAQGLQARESLFSWRRAQQVLGYEPQHSWTDGGAT